MDTISLPKLIFRIIQVTHHKSIWSRSTPSAWTNPWTRSRPILPTMASEETLKVIREIEAKMATERAEQITECLSNHYDKEKTNLVEQLKTRAASINKSDLEISLDIATRWPKKSLDNKYLDETITLIKTTYSMTCLLSTGAMTNLACSRPPEAAPHNASSNSGDPERFRK